MILLKAHAAHVLEDGPNDCLSHEEIYTLETLHTIQNLNMNRIHANGTH